MKKNFGPTQILILVGLLVLDPGTHDPLPAPWTCKSAERFDAAGKRGGCRPGVCNGGSADPMDAMVVGTSRA